MSKGKIVAGVLIGTAVGLATGILTAPKSGKETRADLKVKALRAKEEAAKKAGYVAAKASDITNDVKAKAQDVAENVKTEATDFKHRTDRAVEGANKGFFYKK
jgi:gas vesicle protein